MANPSSRASGLGRVLIAVYGILALAATGRSVVQIIQKFDHAPFAYTLSAVSAVVYIVAMIALIAPGRAWYRVAWVAIGFEMLGVLVVGTLSVVDTRLFPDDTVWSGYGAGYFWVPLVLPIAGLWWLATHRRRATAASEGAAAASRGLGPTAEGAGPAPAERAGE
ncbi:hypothetical protein [Curtobacterium ammoniigenes]|uniref:hypothetical protein n=1 Tax=Curtobacterium ammoniigenes TaxID=395387 RepID=UPI000833FD4D|nr:hypothetical protein [Curtobacterium ammoniigenes]